MSCYLLQYALYFRQAEGLLVTLQELAKIVRAVFEHQKDTMRNQTQYQTCIHVVLPLWFRASTVCCGHFELQVSHVCLSNHVHHAIAWLDSHT